jgi:peroxiredoxin
MISSKVSRLAVIVVLAGAASVGALGCSASQPGASSGGAPAGGGDAAKVGAPAPDFNAEFITGEGPKTLAEAAGKVVIVDFWATFCDPCKKSFPAYQKIVDEAGGNVVVIAISVDEPENAGKEQLIEFTKQTGAKFTVLWDKEGSIRGKKYAVPTMPTSYIIDKTGVVRHQHAGYEDGEDAKVADEVRELLK